MVDRIYSIPRADAPLSVSGGAPTREWYNYLNNLPTGDADLTQLENDIYVISIKLGSPDGTPQNIPPFTFPSNFLGLGSVVVSGTDTIIVTLDGDVDEPGNTYYYGTGPDGAKGFYTIASTLLGTDGDISLATGDDGVTTFDLVDVPDSGSGSLLAITRDTKGRVSGTKAATITGTANRISVANGDAVAGLPTVDIASTYAGQASIVTLGTITTGTWQATPVAPAFGGTGITAYTVGDMLFASSTSALSKLPIGSTGQILTVVGGLPAWSPLTLPPSGVTAGTYGDARHTVQVTVSTTGIITAIQQKAVCPYDSTGLISGGLLSINAGNAALFDMAAGVVLYEDYTNASEPEQKLVPFGPFSAQSIPGIATRNATYIAIDTTGAIVQLASPITPTQRRTMAQIGALIHSNRTTINAINDIAQAVRSTGNQLQDFMDAVGILNISGNVYSANGANLSIDKTAGKIFKQGSNFQANPLDPNNTNQVAQSALTFRYRLSNGTEFANATTIDVNNYESPLGTLTPVPALINTWHVQRIAIFQSGLTRIQYAQNVYPSQAAAIAGIQSDPFVVEQNISENGVFRCYLVINRGILNLNTSAQFITISKFGSPSASNSGTVTSVGITAPAQLSVSGSPVTSSGTIALAWTNQNANLVFSGPASGSAASPSFRNLGANDVLGVTNASNANAGTLGEVFSATSGAVPLTSNTFTDLASIAITPGDWEVTGSVTLSASSAVMTNVFGGISNASATPSPAPFYYQYEGTAVRNFSLAAPVQRFNVSSNTNLYIIGFASFTSGSVNAYGSIKARRMR